MQMALAAIDRGAFWRQPVEVSVAKSFEQNSTENAKTGQG